MINLVKGPQTELLLTMSNDELANEAMALTAMCDMTAQGRMQVRGVLDAFAGDRQRQSEVGAIMLESLLRRTCASMVYACMPYPTMEVMEALESSDKDELKNRAEDVVTSMKVLGLPENFVQGFEDNTVPYILGKYFAVIDTIAALRESDAIWPEDMREHILQTAFETGIPRGVETYEAGSSAENIDRPVSH